MDMKGHQEDTPPSSINGEDEISSLENDEFIYLGDADEILGDDGDPGQSDPEDETPWVPPRDDAVLVNSLHNSSVFCCDIHPNGQFAVTGGEDDIAYVWRMEDGRPVVECTGHKDSVIFAGFSCDGRLVATADMSGVVIVRRCMLDSEDPWTVVWEYEAGDLIWGLWHFVAKVLIFGAATGEIYVFKVPTNDTKVLQGHNSKAECGKLFPDGRHIAVAYEDGSVKVWDIKSESATQHIKPEGLEQGITAIDVHPDNNLIITASPGKIYLIKSCSGKIVGQIDIDIEPETIAFSRDPDFDYFAVGSLEGVVSVWDTARQMERHKCASQTEDDPAGVTKLFWSRYHLVTACLDGSVRIYDGRSGERKKVLTGHLSEVLDICYSSNEKKILTSSEDHTSRVYQF